AQHGRGDPDRRGARLPRARRPAAPAGMGGDALRRPPLPHRLLVDADLSGPRHHDGEPRVQPAGRWSARRARPEERMTMDPILSVEDLRVRFATPHGSVEAVRGISFEVGREKVGIVGESGSGKSTTGRAILKIMPRNAEVSARRLTLQGTDVMQAS